MTKRQFLKFIQLILRKYSKKLINKFHPTIIAITGSVGKTSTKNVIYSILKDKYGDDVRATPGNLNSEIGIPLTILGYQSYPSKFLWPVFLISAYFKTLVKKYPKYLILEVGVDKPGDIKYFSSIAKPDYVIMTSVTPAHTANFKSVEEYQKEKISLISYLNKDGKAIVNFDDPVLSKINDDHVVGVGIDNNRADYLGEIVDINLNNTAFRITKTGKKIMIKSKLIGSHMVYSQLFAFALADLMGFNLISVGKNLEKIDSTPGRMNVLEGVNGMILIDDTYNSNPSSVKAAIKTLSDISYTKGRKILILGNMNELGSIEEKSHIEVGSIASDNCDFAVFIGKNSKKMAHGFKKENCVIFNTRQEFETRMEEFLQPGDLVLIKASQNGNYFEEIVKKLLKDPTKSDKVLVRQALMWKNKKK